VKTKANTMVEGYLKELDHQLRGLPSNRRRELLDELREHIDRARAALESETEAGIRTVLERLGDPAEIASEARERFGVQPTKPGTPWLEMIALVFLVVPFVGWLVGVVLVWTSRLWTTRDKLIGTLGGISWALALLGSLALSVQGAAPVGSAVPVEVGSPPVGSVPEQPTGPGAAAVIAFALPLVVSIATAIYLGIRLRAHSNTAPATR
jgi:hypothetical protein